MLRKEQREQEKEKARAQARAQALLRKEQREQEKEKARAQTLLKKQQWLKRGCATEFDSRKMAKAVQDELHKAGMFDLCLASLQGAAKGKLWSSFLECAELLENDDDNIFFIDIEGRRECGAWEVAIVIQGSRWTSLMNPLRGGRKATREECEDRFCHEMIFGTVYEAFVGVPLPQGQDHKNALALDALHEAVLQHKTLEDLRPEILAATAGCRAGLHYAGDENKWMLESVGYKGKMVNLHQMIQRFFHPLRHLVEDCHFSQSKACLVMKGQWRIAHRAENDALM